MVSTHGSVVPLAMFFYEKRALVTEWEVDSSELLTVFSCHLNSQLSEVVVDVAVYRVLDEEVDDQGHWWLDGREEPLTA